MNKMLVAVFDSDTAAFDGLGALRDLHRDGDITLYGWAVIVKDKAGKFSVRQTLEEGGRPLAPRSGCSRVSLLELLRGPAGLAVGASLSGLTGFLFDLDMSRISPKFLDEVAQTLTRVTEVDESSTTLIYEQVRKHGGTVGCPLSSSKISFVAESTAFEAKLKALEQKLKQALAENRASIQKDIEHVKKQRKAAHDQAKARLGQAKAEMAAKLKVLQDQAKGTGNRAKAQIERRIADLKANLDLRFEQAEPSL